MGLLSALLGLASEADVKDVEETLEQIIADDEKVERAFKLVRDLFIFTNHRLIVVDYQGMTGMKASYHSIPYRAISHFVVQTAGPVNIESDLTIWIIGNPTPIQRTFTRGSTIFEVQKALATYVGR
jgi:hypothetical protein